MTRIFLISDNSKKIDKIKHLAQKLDYQCEISADSGGDWVSQLTKTLPDVVLIDSEFENAPNITKILKSSLNEYNTQVIILLAPNIPKDYDFLTFADGFIQDETHEDIFKNILNSHIKTKKSLDRLSENNKELSRSLYQINALYNTSTQFAGTLDKEELCRIMLGGLEKILSFDIANVLVFLADGSINLYRNSLCELSETLDQALRLRLVLNYKNLFSENNLPHALDFSEINTIKNIKPSHQIYDLKALNFDKLFAPIQVGDNFFGVIEILRQTPFSKEDATFFQTIVHQVALPLRSATFYEEIKNTNVKLEHLERVKSEFVSIVSHELRTPLTPINNSLDIVLSEKAGKITPEVRNFINMAKRNMTRLAGIIEDLLDISRVQTGKLEFKFKKTGILPSLELVEKTFKQSANDKKTKLELNVNTQLSDVYADLHRIEQILSNLISNALKFTADEGKIEISAEKVKIDDEKCDFITPVKKIADEYLKISVKDNGIGMNPEDINKIFDKFSQIESSLARNIGGVGLGLTITKQLIDAHFALISVESKKSKGSTFNVYLPFYTPKTAFQVDLAYELSKNKNLGLFFIEQNKGCGFIQYLKENNLLKRTQNSKELLLSDNKKEYYRLFIPQADKSVMDFMESSVKSLLKKENTKWEKCGIVLKRADRKDTEKINKLMQDVKGN